MAQTLDGGNAIQPPDPDFGTAILQPGDNNGPGSRQLFFLRDGALAALDVSDPVADELGPRLRQQGYQPGAPHKVTTPAYTQRHHVKRLLRYIRGQDVNDEDDGVAPPNAVDFTSRLEYTDPEYTEPRASVMGALFHSQPLVIDYGPVRFIAIGSSDGFLRLIHDQTPTGEPDGSEAWGFMPAETMTEQEQLLDDSVPLPERYPQVQGVDGSPTALLIDRNGDGTVSASDGDRVYLFVGLRRGGRAYYAFDITDPYAPGFMWSVSDKGRVVAGSGTATDVSDYPELGLSFSTPRVALLDQMRPALVFGGGYDGGPPAILDSSLKRPGKDHRGPGQDSETGNAIFVLDARTGELIWKAVRGSATGPTPDPRVYEHAALADAIPSDVALLDSNGDGMHDRLLVGDTGGNLWRAELGPTPDDRKLYRLACLGRLGGEGCSPRADKSDDRRFFHAPDIIQHRRGGHRYDVVVIGSGDRENPLDRQADTSDADLDEPRGGTLARNRVYAIRDDNTVGDGAAELDLLHADLSDVTDCIAGDCEPGKQGWYFSLQHADEKVLSAPVTVAGTVLLSSYVPPSGNESACDPGAGMLYAVALNDGSPSPAISGAGPVANSRATNLLQHGIPADAVPVAPVNTGGGCKLLVLTGETSVTVTGCTRFRTSWQRPG